MSTGKQLHQATQGMVLFIEQQAQEHSAPSPGKYSAGIVPTSSSNADLYAILARSSKDLFSKDFVHFSEDRSFSKTECL